MKEYKIEILYKEDDGYKARKITVDGEERPLPPRLRWWLVQDVLEEMIQNYEENL